METGPVGREPNLDPRPRQMERQGLRPRHFKWQLYVFGIAAAALAAGYAYISEVWQRSDDLAAANQNLTNSLTQVQKQLQSMSEQLHELQVRVALPAAAPRAARPVRLRPGDRVNATHKDPLSMIQAQLSEQRKQIAGARQDIDETRSDLSQTRNDLENNIDSAKSELNTSIARTHDDVVALQKRGERNYYEFTIDKSKRYSRVGPLSIALRKADTKHQRFDLGMQVDDNELQKNSVNLYETIWINLSDRSQPVELVVNKIAKNHIEGYLSEPKYRKSELKSAASLNSAQQVGSVH